MKINTRYAHGVIVVELKGELVGGPDAVKLQDKIKELIAEGQRKVLIDLGGVPRINSSGLGSLISCLTSMRNAGGELKLLNATKRIEHLLTVTQLITVFENFTNEEDAIKSFG
ncbi:MAG: anti-sigma factor antagonist [Gemmatimonadetes bacterium]|nr:MAG: anti-sigma factor antagonist [Gemmatimonadota bacterium]